MKNLQEIQYDWVTSRFYKEKQMDKWARDYIVNNASISKRWKKEKK